ncbi:MAG: phage holin family protein [Raoultibacter sp.]
MIEFLIVTALAMLLDVVTGLAGAVKTSTVQSGKMREGLWHKAGFMGSIAMAYLLEYAAAHIPEFGINVPAVSAVCIFIIATEAVSIIENLCVLNPVIANSPLGKLFPDNKDQDIPDQLLK